MAAISYLWTNRAKPPIASPLYYKVWAKRFFSFPDLLKRNIRRWVLTTQGATIDPKAEIGKVQIDGSRKLLTIGEFSFLGRVHMALHDKVSIGSRVCINDGVQILTASHDVLDPKWRHIKGRVSIDDYAWVGTSAIILPGVSIGKGAVVGAGAVVSKDVPKGVIVVGNPARELSKHRCEELNYNPCEFLSANRSWLVG
jgi:acetyltransferase-like isoleucine patch superfamily enzyme